MGRIVKLAIVAAAVLMAAGCAARPIHVDEMKNSNAGMIYGRLRMPNEDWNLVRLVMIQRVGKVYAGMGLRGVSEKVQSTPDGRYVAANLAPGNTCWPGL